MEDVKVELAVSFNSIEQLNVGTFYYRPRPRIINISPSVLSLNAIRNNSITVQGEGFKDGTEETVTVEGILKPTGILCLYKLLSDDVFNSVSVKDVYKLSGTPINESSLLCPAPPTTLGLGRVVVEVSNNEQDFSNTGHYVSILPPYHIYNIFPRAGSENGENRVDIF
jgi:hypothetical protein